MSRLLASPRNSAARLLAACAALAWIAGTDRVGAQTTIIVDQAGGGDYTAMAPALAAAMDGDTIHVLAGVYQGQIVLNRSITLSCEGPDLVTLRNDSGHTVIVEIDRRATITGCTITGGGIGIALKERSRVHVTNNVIIGNTYGIQRIDGSPVEVSVRNNVIASNRIHATDIGCGCQVVIIGNIITGNGDCGIANPLFQSLTNSYNNIINNPRNYCGAGAGLGDFGSKTGFVTPGFVDANAGDYRLLANAGCRDSGSPVAADNDPDGTRNDCGAYGGPGSAGFFPSPEGGPTIRSMSLFPSSVPKGGTVRLQATGRVNVQ